MEIYKQNQKKQEIQLPKIIERIKAELAQAPEGGLRIIDNNGHKQFYRRTEGGKKNEYIRKNNVALAKKLAQKDYNRRLLPLLEADQRKIEETWSGISYDTLGRVYDELPEIRKSLVIPYFLSDQEYLKRWQNQEYEGKEIDEDVPEIYTEKGERVRSKSEKLIADKLYMMGIPYRYEYPVLLEGVGLFYPDFTLLDIRQRKEVLLEHFGMMDTEEYSIRAVQKINTYINHGYIPGDQLLFTFETRSCPLDTRVLRHLLERFC